MSPHIMPAIPSWTPEQEAVMRQRYPVEGASIALQQALGRTQKALHNHARLLGISKPRSPRWKKEDDLLLRQRYHAATEQELLALFPQRNMSGIWHRAQRLGLTTAIPLWTAEEDDALKRCYPHGQWQRLRRALPNRTVVAIRNRVALLGISMTPEARKRSLCASQKRRGHRVFPSYGKIIGSVISHALAGAEERHLDCALLDGSDDSMRYLDSVAHDRCALSGRPIVYKVRPRDSTATASLDRIDSTKGYVKGNVQWVHKDINRMKQDIDDETFIALCNEVARYRGAST